VCTAIRPWSLRFGPDPESSAELEEGIMAKGRSTQKRETKKPKKDKKK
jgi:hypothetical protein